RTPRTGPSTWAGCATASYCWTRRTASPAARGAWRCDPPPDTADPLPRPAVGGARTVARRADRRGGDLRRRHLARRREGRVPARRPAAAGVHGAGHRL